MHPDDNRKNVFRIGTKKIDCLTTTNLVNLKSNTMKNTLQKYGEFLFPTNFRKKICAIFAFFNHSNAILADIIEY